MGNCSVAIPNYIPLDCYEFDSGRIVACAFISDAKDFTDLTDPAEWADETYESDIVIFQEVRGSYPPASPQTQPSYGAQASRTVGLNHVINLRVPAILGNEDFWDAVNLSNDRKFAFVTGVNYEILWYVNQVVQILGVPNVDEGLDTNADWQVTISWTNMSLPSTSAVPTGIFQP